MLKLVEELVRASLGGSVIGTAPLEGGAVGRVFVSERAGEGPRSVCVKLVEAHPVRAFVDESADERIYGSRSENYDDARTLLAAVVRVPALYSTGLVADEAGARWRYWVMEHLPGSAGPAWSAASDREVKRLHELIGETLARIHKVQREWPGWIALPETSRWQWGPMLFEALRHAISRAGENELLPANVRSQLFALAEQHESTWTDPASFCLSHPDGLQGIFEYHDAEWRIRGIVDIEDHFFLDPRFALAGIELQSRLAGGALPGAFRAGYTSVRPWPEGFDNARPVYQMLFLCTWSRVCRASHLADLALEVGRCDAG